MENQTQQQAQPTAQTSQAPTGGRKVFGVDGKEPISEHEFIRQSWDPALVEQADQAIQAAAQRQQVVADQPPTSEELADLRRKYDELQNQHNEIAQYGGIINALKSDPDLVATMQKAIAGELYDIENANKKRKDAEFGDSFRNSDDDDQDDAPNRGQGNPHSQRQREQEIAQRAAREAELRIEMQTVMREMMQTGASEEEVNRFIAFVNQPGGLTMHDLLTVYRSRGTKGQPPQPQAQQKQTPPAPLATAAGQTDRPKGEARYQNHEDFAGRYFPGNANVY